MKHLRNIRRIDDDASRTHAWLVQVQRKTRITIKMFSDSVHGGKRKAMQAAVAYREQLLAEECPVDYQLWLRSILRRNNSSRIPGVARYEALDRRAGRRQVFWLASWIDEHGTSRKRKFTVRCYGERRAKQLACAERERQLKHVCALKCSQVACLTLRPRGTLCKRAFARLLHAPHFERYLP